MNSFREIYETEWARIKYEKLENEDDDNSFHRIKSIFGKKSLAKRIPLPWNRSLKDIESRYGGGFVSLFEFIRWLFFFNLITAILILVFILLPQALLEPSKIEQDLKNTSLAYQTCDDYVLLESINSSNSTTLNSSNLEDQILFAKCCTLKYNEYLTNLTADDDFIDSTLDIIKGTGIVERSFVFYGFYSNKRWEDDTNEKEYLMGVSFALITISSLLISAITMLIQLGKSTRKKIVQRLDSHRSMEFCNRTFCTWDYRIKVIKDKDNFFVEYTKSSFLRGLKVQLDDIYFSERLKYQTLTNKIWILTKRVLINIFTIALFIGAGYVFFEINQISFKAKEKSSMKAYVFLLEYVPAIMLKVINILFRVIFQRLQPVEEYKKSTSITVFLLRTGIARIGVLFFLIITITTNIIQNNNVCASQSNDLLQELKPDDLAVNRIKDIWCWESYVGQEFYKLVFIDFILQFVFLLYELLAKLLYKYTKWEYFNFCFDLETKFLDLLAIQTVFWLSLYFSPFIGLFGPFFYFVKFYTNLLSIKRLTNFSKANQIDSKINSSFFFIFFGIFLFILIVFGIIFTLVRPSKSCGSFKIQYSSDDKEYSVLYEILNQFKEKFPYDLSRFIDFIFSYVFWFSVALAMIFLIWFFFNFASAYKSMARELRIQINEEQSKNERLLKKHLRDQARLNNSLKRRIPNSED